MTQARLVLVRHGVTDWNREGRFQGHMDPALGDHGHVEARLVAERLAADPGLRPSRVVSSSLRRAMETAAHIAGAAGVEVEAERRLIEIGQGRWEGRTHAELAVSDARRYAAWRSATEFRRPPGGEPAGAALARVRELVSELSGSADRGRALCLVSHGGTLRLVARVLFGLSARRAWALDVDNASVSVAVRRDGAWALERWNDTRHLLGTEPTHVDEAEGRPLAL